MKGLFHSCVGMSRSDHVTGSWGRSNPDSIGIRNYIPIRDCIYIRAVKVNALTQHPLNAVNFFKVRVTLCIF